jgi:tetratricopeptide (TPR) repeat protein
VTPPAARRALFLVLGLLYAAVWLPWSIVPGSRASEKRFDPLSPHGRQVEEWIETKRFADALPVALDLARANPGEPQVEFWLGEIYRGLDRPADEVNAWERFVAGSSMPAAACPALAKAYERAHKDREAVDAYERCARFAPDDAERLLDLGDALAARQRADEALAAYQRASKLDETDERPRRRIQRLTGAAGR